MQSDPVLLAALKDVQTRLGTIVHALEVSAPTPVPITVTSTISNPASPVSEVVTNPAPASTASTIDPAKAPVNPAPASTVSTIDPAKAPVKPAPAPVIHIPVPAGDHNLEVASLKKAEKPVTPATPAKTPIGDWIMPGLRR